ncbi:MAG: CbtB-domain containing protein [Gammaproteobacteria bacterium]
MATPTEQSAAAAAPAAAAPVAIPVRKVMPWAVLGSLVMVFAYYFVGAEQGATSVVSGMGVHEFVHDARHLLGFPCH